MGTQGIRRGMPVDATDGFAGSVHAVVRDREQWGVTHVVVDRQAGDAWLVPSAAVAGVEGGRLQLRGKWSELAGVRPFRPEEFSSLAEETRAAEPRVDARMAGTARAGQVSAAVDTAAPGAQQLDLLEERLQISKELEQAGAIRISKQVLEHTETIAVPVREERVVLTCAPGRGPVRVGDDELHEGEQLEITVMKERVIVQTEPVFMGGLVLRREAIEGNQTVQAQLRTEELTVEDPDGLVVERWEAGRAQREQP